MKVYSTLLVTFFMISMINCQKKYEIKTKPVDNTVVIETNEVGSPAADGQNSLTFLNMRFAHLKDPNTFWGANAEPYTAHIEKLTNLDKPDDERITIVYKGYADNMAGCENLEWQSFPLGGTFNLPINVPHFSVIVVNGTQDQFGVNDIPVFEFSNTGATTHSETLDEVAKITLNIGKGGLGIDRDKWFPPANENNLKHRMIV